MTTSSRRTHPQSQRLARDTVDVMIASPLVAAHRLMRMAMAGPQPNARDRREFSRMGEEKMAAFFESWAGMGLALWRAQFEFARTMFAAPFTAASRGNGTASPASTRFSDAACEVLSEGLAPIRRRAMANARRLRRLR